MDAMRIGNNSTSNVSNISDDSVNGINSISSNATKQIELHQESPLSLLGPPLGPPRTTANLVKQFCRHRP